MYDNFVVIHNITLESISGVIIIIRYLWDIIFIMRINVNREIIHHLLEAANTSASGGVDIKTIKKSVFEVHDTLNPDIFDADNKMLKMIRERLLRIGRDAFEFLGMDSVKVRDIIVTGSQANYNWSKYSDIDLHIVISYSEISENTELVSEFVWSKKELWNKDHDIELSGYLVEIYYENIDEDTLIAGGIYSVLRDKWLRFPKKMDLSVDQGRMNKIVDYFNNKFLELQRRFDAGDTYGLYDDISSLLNDINNLRQRGLNNGGEFSEENMAFKALRRMDINSMLNDLKSDLYDQTMSIEKTANQKLRDDEPMFKDKDDKEKIPKKDKEPIAQGLGRYKIHGKMYTSLRKAEKVLGIPKSTLEYRIKSDNPEFSDYVELDI